MGEVLDDKIMVGMYVIIKKHNYSKLHKISANGHVMLGKDQVSMKEVIGKPFWTTFEMVPNKNGKRTFSLKVASNIDAWEDFKSTMQSGPDNRTITDDGTSQKLSKEEILSLQESGKSGKEIIGSLIENSKSFIEKTEYSQEKYIKKKERKYFKYVTICKPTLVSLHSVYFRQDQFKIGGLRMDALSQLLCYGDVQSNGLYILYDSGSQGLPAAAIMNRIGANTTGQLINLHPGNMPQTAALQAMNFPKEQMDRNKMVNIYSFLRLYYQGNDSIWESITSLTNSKVICDTKSCDKKITHDQILHDDNCNGTAMNDDIDRFTESEKQGSIVEESIDIQVDELNKLDEAQKKNEDGLALKRKLSESIEATPTKKPKWFLETQCAVELISNAKAHGLVIVAKEHPLNIVNALLPFLGLSRPFVIFHVFREPLQETYASLKRRQGIINLKLITNFLRSYQVLPDRTHPDISTSDTGGYILTGYLGEA